METRPDNSNCLLLMALINVSSCMLNSLQEAHTQNQMDVQVSTVTGREHRMDDFALEDMFLTLPFLVGATFLYCILHRTRLNSRPPQPPSPPSPRLRLPVIGHLYLLLLTDAPHRSFARLSQRLGPIFQLQLGRVRTLVISSARLARIILKTHDHAFASRPQLVAAQCLSFGCSDVTFSPYGRYWRQARKICVSELLSHKRVNSFEPIRDRETSRLMSSLSARSGSETNASELFFAVANDVLCGVAFGRTFDREEAGQKGHLVEVLTETQELLAGFCLGDFFPEWEWVNRVSGLRRRLRKNLEDLRRVCDEIVEEHLKKRDGNEKEDFVDVLLRVQQRDDLEVPITDDNLRALVLDMFIAGTDTTSATLEWTMTELMRHPKVMKKAQDEVRRVASPTGRVIPGHLEHLSYMKAVIKETMRLHPPVPLLVPRESIETCTIEGYEVPAETRVLINAYAIGRNPKSWEMPLEFKPERFEHENIEFQDRDFRFLPFGGGRRGCPGHAFGLATVENTLARLLYHFDWQLPHGVRPDDMDLSEIFGLATRKRYALILVPLAHKDYKFEVTNA